MKFEYRGHEIRIYFGGTMPTFFVEIDGVCGAESFATVGGVKDHVDKIIEHEKSIENEIRNVFGLGGDE